MRWKHHPAGDLSDATHNRAGAAVADWWQRFGECQELIDASFSGQGGFDAVGFMTCAMEPINKRIIWEFQPSNLQRESPRRHFLDKSLRPGGKPTRLKCRQCGLSSEVKAAGGRDDQTMARSPGAG